MTGCRHDDLEVPPAPRALVMVLDGALTEPSRARLERRLQEVLLELGWRAHVYLAGREGPPWDADQRWVFDRIAGHVDGHPLATVSVHPHLDLGQGDAGARATLDALNETARPFQTEAYDLQGEPRLLLLPVLHAGPGISPAQVRHAVARYRAAAARPTLHVAGGPAPDPDEVERTGLRVFLSHGRPASLLEQLWMNLLFEDCLARLESHQPLAQPCRPHLVLDADTAHIDPCLRRAAHADPAPPGEPPAATGLERPGPDACRACLAAACVAMRDNYVANRRENEGRRVCMGLAVELAEVGDTRAAADLALTAADLAETDRDRAAAWLHAGLCLRELGEYERADEVLARGARVAEDPALFAYHRGRVQFDWRDYIEALDRFEEALAVHSPGVPRADLLFFMAASHVYLEEYPEARTYLERLKLLGPLDAPALFHEGLCFLGLEAPDRALERFLAALNAGPSPEDLGRIHFYVATALKELERYAEAVPHLQAAIELEPDEYAYHNLLGFCLFKEKRHQESIQALERAVELKPYAGIDHASIGSNLRELGRYDEALVRYRRALELDPTLTFARENIVRIERMTKPARGKSAGHPPRDG